MRQLIEAFVGQHPVGRSAFIYFNKKAVKRSEWAETKGACNLCLIIVLSCVLFKILSSL